MPIIVQCTCGQTIQTSNFLAGKTCKCPQCGGWVNIPHAPQAAPPPPPPPPAPKPPGGILPRATATSVPIPRSPSSANRPISATVTPLPSRLPPPTFPRAMTPPVAPPIADTRAPVNPFASPDFAPASSNDELELQPPPPPASHEPSLTSRAAYPRTKTYIPPVVRGKTGIVPPENKPNLFGSARYKPKPGSSAVAELRYWLLSLALFPLVFSLFRPDDNVEQRFKDTLQHLPVAQKEKIKSAMQEDDEESGLSKLLSLFPDGRIEGAHLPRNSHTQWFYAIVSAAIYWAIILLLFPLGNAKASHLLLSGLFTGTIGILILLGFQWVAFHTGGVWIRGGGMIALFMLILKVIGLCYQLAHDPSSGFALSLVGFTFGIGLCEEVCKGLVLFYMFRDRTKLDWRGACVWGLASGVGFGVTEGIMYAGMYNGLMRYDIYLIRFISCVALHGIWAAAVGLSAYRNQAELRESKWYVVKICFVPMLLHGLYDALLKQEYPDGAVLVALCSFAWLAYQFECTYASFGTEDSVVTA